MFEKLTREGKVVILPHPLFPPLHFMLKIPPEAGERSALWDRNERACLKNNTLRRDEFPPLWETRLSTHRAGHLALLHHKGCFTSPSVSPSPFYVENPARGGGKGDKGGEVIKGEISCGLQCITTIRTCE